MISSLLVVAGLSVLIIVHEWGHFLAARYFNLWVQEFGFGFPPKIFSKKRGDTVYSFNLIPLGGFVKIFGENAFDKDSLGTPERSFANQPIKNRTIVVLAGVFMNFIFGWLLLSLFLFIGSPSLIVIDLVNKNSPAESVGLERGDKILGYESVDKLIAFINNNQGQEITLNIGRGNEEFPVKVTPRSNPANGKGALGVGLRDIGVPRHGFFTSLIKGLLASFNLLMVIVVGLYQAVFNPAGLIGPVGIFNVAINTGELGVVYLLQLLSLISLNLVVLNLLPIPALDGGRLLFLFLEKIRGKKFSFKIEARANAISFSLLLFLMIIITVKDIINLL